MSTKSPYELRFEVLEMAKGLMDQQHDLAMTQFYSMMETAKDNAQEMEKITEKYLPKMYQPKEIMAKAEELYKFIQKKD